MNLIESMREHDFAVTEGGGLILFDSGDIARSMRVDFSNLREGIEEPEDARALIEGLISIQDRVGKMLLELISS